ncbi:hypothetical protein [Ralstonia edaphi]|uniref:hypothetical protein n=1 Tax=Ralstonia edaphi TaxID=3058599 RepID=UPI0029301C0C|nr:hypothetical protein [Ralstonia sp. LMG 6871]
MLNRFAGVVGALVFAVGLTACDKLGTPLKWTEDVRLPDGRIVTLTRYQEFNGWRDLGGPPTESDYWFEFRHPDTGQIVRWKWDRTLESLALMMDGRTPMLLVMPNFNGSEQNKCPNPPYLLYRFAGGWEQVPLADRRAALLPSLWSKATAMEASQEARRSLGAAVHLYGAGTPD